MTRKQKKNLTRIIISAVLLAVSAIVTHFFEFEWYVELALFAVPYFFCGYDVLLSAVRNIFHGQMLDEKFLMTVATVGAFALGENTEAVAVMLLYQTGELFQSIAVGRSRRSIAALMDIRPDTATVIRDGTENEVSPDAVSVGEIIIVRPGEKIPLDGVITEGKTTLDTSALTGESIPRDADTGDRVISGSVNLSGLIKIQTESEFSESTVSKILELVENSADKKAKTENFITRFARYYTPAVVGGAVLLAVIPPIVTHGGWGTWISRALNFLVVSCPCALVISIPMAFFGGIGGASRKGILVKGSTYFETLAKTKIFVFDKTGTLTKGSFTVTAIHPKQVSEEELLDLAAAAEKNSNHPIAESIASAHGGHIDESRIGSIRELSGLGIEAVIDSRNIAVGNGKLMEKVGAEYHECHHTGTVIHIADGDEYLGHIVISDVIKASAAEAVAELKALGAKKTVMLTGDRRAVGEDVAKEIGIDEVHTELMPRDKVAEVEGLMGGDPLAFVGDGINDAPVLSRADVGIAMGALGSDAAIEAADIVLMDDSPMKLSAAVKLARKTMRIVRENIIFSLSVKGAVLLLSAVGLAGMGAAVFADVGVMIIAILNSMRAIR